MQVISVIGRTEGAVVETEHAGRRFLRFGVNVRSTTDGSSHTYTVVTSRMALEGSLAPGTDVFVSGYLNLSPKSPAATIQALLIQVIEPREKSPEELKMECFTSSIPLQDI